MTRRAGLGIAGDLSVMVHALTVQAKGFRIDRIELRSDMMRSLEDDLALAFAGKLVSVNEPTAERRFAGLLCVEVTRDDAPPVALVLDMQYKGTLQTSGTEVVE